MSTPAPPQPNFDTSSEEEVDIDINLPTPSSRIIALIRNAGDLSAIGQFGPANALIAQANILMGNDFSITPPQSPYRPPGRMAILILDSDSDSYDYMSLSETSEEEEDLHDPNTETKDDDDKGDTNWWF